MTKKKLAVLLCCILCAIGVLFVLLGFSEARGVEGEDLMSTHMFLTIPGLLGIGTGFLTFTRKHYRSGFRFVFSTFLYSVLVGFLAECFYFQFIFYGIKESQTRLMIPAALISFFAAVLYMIFTATYSILYAKVKD